jgi:hypothetical protein
MDDEVSFSFAGTPAIVGIESKSASKYHVHILLVLDRATVSYMVHLRIIKERCCIMFEITAMTGAPGCTSWIQLQQTPPMLQVPTDALLARMTTIIQSSSVGSYLLDW